MANVEKFKYWCNKILPLVYDDSLSYYEFLGKVYEKLNETIDAVNDNTAAIAEFDQRINDFIDAETAARKAWEDQQELDRQTWENQQALKWSAFQAMFISEYDPDETYVKGDLCSVQYKMYVANASTTGTFDPTKWDEIVLTEYLAEYFTSAYQALQEQYDDFLENYQRTFGIIDHFAKSTTDAPAVSLLYKLTVGQDKMIPGGYGDLEGQYYGSTGTLVIDSNYNSGNLIPCKAGNSFYKYKRDTDVWDWQYSQVTYWDAEGNYVSGVYLSESTEAIEVPADNSIAFMRTPYPVADVTRFAICEVKTETAPPLWYDVHNFQQKINTAVDDSIAHHFNGSAVQSAGLDLVYDLIVSDNKLIPGGYGDIEGHYYSSTGAYITLASFNSGNLIPCKAGDVIYKCNRNTNEWNWYGSQVTYWDKDGDFVSGQYVSANTESLTVPNNAAIRYVRTPYPNTDPDRYAVTFVKTSDIPPVWYDPNRILDKINALKPGHQWNGKTWYAYGTSITSTAQGHYVDPLASMLNCTAVNKGIPGGGIGDLGAYSTGQVYTAICNTTDGKLNADLITLETGANDVNADVPLGTIYDTGTTTLAGCLNDCIRYLQTNTTAQIAIICSPSTTTAPQATNQYFTWLLMIEQICRINNVCFIPNETNMGYAKLTSSTGSLYVLDNIHQTELGGYTFAENIFKYLKDLPTFKASIPS